MKGTKHEIDGQSMKLGREWKTRNDNVRNIKENERTITENGGK